MMRLSILLVSLVVLYSCIQCNGKFPNFKLPISRKCDIPGQVMSACDGGCRQPKCSGVICYARCITGCKCPDGLLLNYEGTKCVTKEDCDVPDTEERPKICYLPSETGPCMALFHRYYYNADSDSCEEFVYGGCRGNKNNFETKEKCEAVCDADTGDKQCGDIPGQVESECDGGCRQPTCSGITCLIECAKGCKCPDGLVLNNEGTKCIKKEDCEDTEERPKICYLPSETGPCKGSFPRYYYNADSDSCEEFVYGGCRGNKNNFETKEECEAVCDAGTGDEQCGDIPGQVESECDGGCRQPTCSGITCLIECAKGCKCPDGLVLNNEGTKCIKKEDCEDTEERPKICYLPSETGPCRALFHRYYYNADSNSCEEFVYGGCRGNKNNFETKEECEAVCG